MHPYWQVSASTVTESSFLLLPDNGARTSAGAAADSSFDTIADRIVAIGSIQFYNPFRIGIVLALALRHC